MTDIAPSLFDASAASPLTSQFDASVIDRNVRAISAVESSWRQPALPPEVKFDLATAPGMNEAGLFEFMTGLDDDLAEEPAPEPFNPRERMPNQSGFDQARIILAGVAGNTAPQQVSSDAVQEFKRRAIRDGYLDADAARIDSTWSPEFNRIRSQMAYDDVTEGMAGNRWGAMPLTDPSDDGSLGGVMGVLNRLTSPTGLLAAATDLDLFWDVGAIGNEVSSWGDKWRKLGHSKNPFDFAKNFVDAVTGPIDDIVFPILNWATLVTGVGAAWNGARVGFQGARLGATGVEFGRLFNAGRIGRNLTELGEASMTASRLLRSENTLIHGAGALMAGYRKLPGVIGVKSALQPVLRAGVLSQVEGAFPGYQGGGFELSDFGAVESAQDTLFGMMNDPRWMPLEVLVAPYNIFNPGTFIRHTADDLAIVNRVGHGLFSGLGSAPGRAAAGAAIGAVVGTAQGDDVGDTARGALIGSIGGALLPQLGKLASTNVGSAAATVGLGALAGGLLGDDPSDIALGALAGIGFVAMPGSARASFLDQLGSNGVARILKTGGQGAQLTSFKALAEDQAATLGFHSSVRRVLADRPEELAAWDQDFAELGLLKTIAKRQTPGVNDEELAADTVGFVFTNAVAHWVAKAQAGKAGKGWWDRFYRSTNKLKNQVRQFDLEHISDSTLDDIANAWAWSERGDQGYLAVVKRARQLRDEMAATPGRALEIASDHNRKAVATIDQMMHPTNFPKLDDVPFGEENSGIRDLIGNNFARETTEGVAWIMHQYMVQEDIFSTIADYPKFAHVTAELALVRGDGLLKAATLKPYRSRFGHLKSIRGKRTALEQTERTAIDGAVTDLMLSDAIDPSRLPNTHIAPVASQYHPGRVTVARAGTKLKGEYEELAERLRDLKDVTDHWRKLPTKMNWRAELKKLAPNIDPEVTNIGTLAEHQISQIVKQASKTPGSKSLGYVLGFARREGLSLAQVDAHVLRSVDEMVADSKLWSSFNFADNVEDEFGRQLGGIEALSKRLKDVVEKSRRTAAEVDTEDLIRYLRETGDEAGAVRVQALSDKLAEDGYKMAHGVEFLMPEDLIHGPIFKDVTTRHQNAATLGNWFKGKLPPEAHIIQDRRHRLALAKTTGFSPESKEVDEILDQLRKFLRVEQDKAEAIVRDIDHQPIGQRLSSRFTSAFAPLGMDEVSRSKKQLVAALAERWGDEKALAIWRASKQFRNSDFKDVGLYGIEAAARKFNVAEWGLKTLTGSKWGDSLIDRGRGLALPAAVGAAVGVAGTDSDASFEEKLKALALGGAAGAGVALAGRAVATGASEAARLLPGSGSLVDRSANWSYGYMADMYARMRDAFRFTLSPMFDISRYTEGMLLAQTAAPLRKADGSRLVLNFDMSPRGLQRSLRNKLMEADPKLAKTTAARRAREKYQGYVSDFQKMARSTGDFDAEALDGTGRWFKQVGIMGFSPTDWMGTAFARLMEEGLDHQQAYEAARSMYTYGTRGRSAAEMSANFVFFPFSFQKKALGHIAKWMNDDLARSIIIHDALKTYEILDERYDLDRLWKDHLPALQQLQKLNLVAYGISPGRLGGMNAQLFETTGKLAWNLFVPGATTIKSQADAAEFTKLWKGLLPAVNDINVLVRNLKEEGHVMFSESHQTTRADITAGFNEWNEYKTQLTDELQDRGYVLSDIHNKPWLEDVKFLYDTKKAELAAKYPAWADSMDDFVGEKMALEVDRKQAVDRAAGAAQGIGEASPTDLMIAQMEQVLDEFRTQLQLYTGSRDLTDADPAVFDEIHRIAAEMARENPYFKWVWEKFYRPELGVLTVDLELAS